MWGNAENLCLRQRNGRGQPGLGRDSTQAGNHFSSLGDKYLSW